MAKNYKQLMTEVCALIGFGEPQRVIDGEAIVMGDVMFSLIHDEKIDPQRVFVFASFGELPRENRAEVLEELLRQNHAGFDGRGPGFGISPTSGKVVYARHFFLDKTEPVDLANSMGYLAQLANEWRRTRFLDRVPPKAAASRPGLKLASPPA